MRRVLVETPEFRAQDQTEMKARMKLGMASFLKGFFQDKLDSGLTVIDKSRGWIGYIELIEEVLGRKCKFIVPVRDLRDVAASFEKLHRKNPLNRMSQENENFNEWQTLEGRLGVWFRPNQPIGVALNRISDIFNRGLADRIFVVRFEDLVSDAKSSMKALYEFLGMKEFAHDFDNVKQVTHENDVEFGIPELHTIRSKVEPMKENWRSVIPENLGFQYKSQYAWFYNLFYQDLNKGTL